jgi:4-hydroxyphenylpyruvate dioxygenase-like putative hemolysin
MKILLTILAVTMLMASSGCFAQTQTATTSNLFLVQNGKPRGVIVASAKPTPAVQNAIDELQYHVKRASGTALQVVDEKAAAALPADTARIVFAANNKLPVETYQIKTQGNTLVFTSDGTNDDSLQWAVDYYLDTQLGARWLWPGDVGK